MLVVVLIIELVVLVQPDAGARAENELHLAGHMGTGGGVPDR